MWCSRRSPLCRGQWCYSMAPCPDRWRYPVAWVALHDESEKSSELMFPYLIWLQSWKLTQNRQIYSTIFCRCFLKIDPTSGSGEREKEKNVKKFVIFPKNHFVCLSEIFDRQSHGKCFLAFGSSWMFTSRARMQLCQGRCRLNCWKTRRRSEKGLVAAASGTRTWESVFIGVGVVLQHRPFPRVDYEPYGPSRVARVQRGTRENFLI